LTKNKSHGDQRTSHHQVRALLFAGSLYPAHFCVNGGDPWCISRAICVSAAANISKLR
jgi:hypothetical protein